MSAEIETVSQTSEPSRAKQLFGQSIFSRWPRLYGLRGKLIIPYVLLTVLLAMIGIFVVTRLVTDSVRERFANQIYEASRVSADSIVRQEQKHLDILRNIALTKGIAEAFLNRDIEFLELQTQGIAAVHRVQIISVLDTEGQELITLGLDPATGSYIRSQGTDFSQETIVRNILTEYTDEQGDKFIDLLETRNGLALVTSAPVRSTQDGQLVGVLLVGTRLESLLADIKAQALADIVLLDQERNLLGTTLVAPSEGYQELEKAAIPFVQQINVSSQEVSLYGRDYQVFYTPFAVRGRNLGWLGVVLPSQYVTTPEATSRSTFSALFAVGTAATIIIGYLLALNIARPILRLRSMSQAVASGDLNQSIQLRQADEIGDLANAFDQMTAHLRERTAEAERLYAETVQRNKELAEINARLQATQLQLIQSEKLAAIGQLTAGIVHDVKNPLAVIKGMAEVIREDPSLSEDARQGLALIHESAVKANRIVTDLLKFARQAKPEMKTQDLRETVEAALRLTTYLIREAKIQVVTELPQESILLKYDSQQIEQVFINLITNAVQAMREQGLLRIRLYREDRMVAVAFEDNGIGIPPEYLNRIFDPFFTTKREGEGTGLGLSVSYGIVASHNGHIEVKSSPGQGSTFTVYLPYEPPELASGKDIA